MATGKFLFDRFTCERTRGAALAKEGGWNRHGHIPTFVQHKRYQEDDRPIPTSSTPSE
jgi:hypothetical protein